MRMTQWLVMMMMVIYMVAVRSWAGRQGETLGGYTSITDLDDEHVQDIAKYAVTQHNLKAGTHLEYLQILSAEYQVAAGNNYHLFISAKDQDHSGAVNSFEAVVNDKPWQISRTLTSFNVA